MPEVRPIDANALIDKLDIMISKSLLADTAVHYALIRELVAEQPTIDAEPVRHGRWETIDSSFAHVYCSECGAAADKHLAKRYKGCPFCLCVMDATDTNVGGKGGADNG